MAAVSLTASTRIWQANRGVGYTFDWISTTMKAAENDDTMQKQFWPNLSLPLILFLSRLFAMWLVRRERMREEHVSQRRRKSATLFLYWNVWNFFRNYSLYDCKRRELPFTPDDKVESESLKDIFARGVFNLLKLTENGQLGGIRNNRRFVGSFAHLAGIDVVVRNGHIHYLNQLVLVLSVNLNKYWNIASNIS